MSREKIREKDGVALYRVRTGQGSHILKKFRRGADLREIRYYEILRECGVPAIHVLGRTKRSLLLEDLETSPVWRLGREEDMADPQTARAVAQWYRALHAAGRQYPRLRELPAETDALTEVNLRALSKVFPDEAFWPKLFAHYDAFRRRLDALPQTLTYNDFHWTNLAVARDGAAALLFDYNRAGRGHAYGDLRNVTWSLSEEAGRAFLEAYGEEPGPAERALDALADALHGLWTASRRESFPQWAQSARAKLEGGALLRSLEAIL